MTSQSMTSQWTPEAIRSLGSTTDVPTLGSIFGLGICKSRQMARTGEWERAGIRILKTGRKYRVTVPSILSVLGNGDTSDTEDAAVLPEQADERADGTDASPSGQPAAQSGSQAAR